MSRRRTHRRWTSSRPRRGGRSNKVVVIGIDRHKLPEQAIGLRPGLLKAVFFVLLSASVVAAMQTVGAFLVIAMVVTPGATAYLLCDRFPRLILTSIAIGTVTSFLGAYASYFLDGATGGVIVTLQTLIFLAAFVFAPKHGVLAAKAKAASCSTPSRSA